MRLESRLRDIKFKVDFVERDFRSVLIEWGRTKVICSATINDGVPHFLRGTKSGWLKAEYSMLPCSSNERIVREAMKGKQSGRTWEIQRLIGRSLRKALDLSKLGEKTITVDCDVLQADGGTRVASITGGYIAMKLAIAVALKRGILRSNPIVDQIAAISVGIANGDVLLDLNFEEDVLAEVDMNIAMNGRGEYIEIQGSSEKGAFNQNQLIKMISLAQSGIIEVLRLQNEVEL